MFSFSFTLNIFCANLTNMPATNFSSQKPKATTRTSLRQGPLHACGVSVISIGNIAFAKSQEINGPLGSYLRMMAKLCKFFTPLIYAMQYQWLAILSFMDDRILAAERITEKVFPPAAHLFDKMDELVLIIASMPEKVDGAVNKFPTMMYKVRLQEWAMTHFVSRLNSLVSVLDNWEIEDPTMKEKTIGVDRDFKEKPSSSSPRCITTDPFASFPPIPEAAQKEVHDNMMKGVPSSHMKGSYKEALLEKTPHEKKDESCEEGEKGPRNEGETAVMKCQIERTDDNNKGGDVLLKLFDAWLMNPGRL